MCATTRKCPSIGEPERCLRIRFTRHAEVLVLTTRLLCMSLACSALLAGCGSSGPKDVSEAAAAAKARAIAFDDSIVIDSGDRAHDCSGVGVVYCVTTAKSRFEFVQDAKRGCEAAGFDHISTSCTDDSFPSNGCEAWVTYRGWSISLGVDEIGNTGSPDRSQGALSVLPSSN
jgi:hypothetical protein